MLTTEKIYTGMFGFVVNVKTGIDLSNATTTNILVSKPNGLSTTWGATPKSPATAGILTYTVTSGDIEVHGKYMIQSELVFPANPPIPAKKLYGKTAFFMVYERYN